MHECAAALFLEIGCCCARHIEIAVEIDRTDQVPILFRHLVENDITKDAGIVDHGVDLAKGPNGILNDGFGAVPFRNRMEARYGDSASGGDRIDRSEEYTSELQSLMRTSYA